MSADSPKLQSEVTIDPGKDRRVGPRRPAPAEPDPPRIPRIARLMALAIRFQDMVDRGEVREYADLARLGFVTRARLTQIMNLLMLAPEIQEELLRMRPSQRRSAVSEQRVRSMTSLVLWHAQRTALGDNAQELERSFPIPKRYPPMSRNPHARPNGPESYHEQAKGKPIGPSWTRSDSPGDATLFFDFDNDFLSLHTTRAVQRLAENLQQTKAAAIQVNAYRGASKLSKGQCHGREAEHLVRAGNEGSRHSNWPLASHQMP